MGFAAEIERIIAADPGERGIGGLVQPGDLARAAVALQAARTVLITTGFCVLSARSGETDGPPGAVVLSKALEAMGRKVVLVTDQYSHSILTATAAVYGVKAVVVEASIDAGEDYYAALLRHYQPSHIVAVERPGQAADGKYYNMRGGEITELTARTDHLFNLGRAAGIVAIGLGDGGNELGMGKVSEAIRRHIPGGAKIGAVAAADHLIVAGVTNWGAYGLVTYLSALLGTDLLHDPDWEEILLDTMLQQGAVDGVTAAASRRIDGLPIEVHCALVATLKARLGQYLDAGKTAAVAAN